MGTKRPLPPLHKDDLEDFLHAVEHPEDATSPPWVYARPFKDPEDAAVLAAVTAVHLIRPRDLKASPPEPWLIRALLRTAPGAAPSLTRLTVEHFLDAEVEVTGTVLRGVPVADIRNRAHRLLREQGLIVGVLTHLGWASPERQAWAERVSEEAARVTLTRGRKGYPPEHYRRIALRYLALVDEGHRAVLKELAAEECERLGREIPYQTVREWVRRATELGFLSPGRRGRAEPREGPNLYPQEEGTDG